MEKRTVVALVLVALVIVITPRLFPSNRPAVPSALVDTSKATSITGNAARAPVPEAVQKMQPVVEARDTNVTGNRRPVEKTLVGDSLSSFEFNTAGAALSRVILNSYGDLTARKTETPVVLTAGSVPVLSYRLVTSRDTIDLQSVLFNVHVDTLNEQDHVVTYNASVRGSEVSIRYQIKADSFLTYVKGSVTPSDSMGELRYLLINLPETLRSFEADTVDDQHHLAFAYRVGVGDAKSLPFGKLDPGEKQIVSGPVSWVVAKSKYFLVGVLSAEKDSGFAEFSAVGGLRASRTATHAKGTIVLRLPGGAFAFEIYAGPQHWRRLTALGRDFQNSNPYGGFLQPVVQPFATIVMKILLWMRENLKISYGWVLVIFGIAVRLVLWPLNQKGMRASMKMQRIQPELNEIQKRYKSDPQKMQTEMMRVYKEHDMSPFSTFAGCLPLFLPLPVLFALFFVFQNTIEFRGVPFLWFHDISQKDPLYIVPLAMGISMFVLSWIGMRNTPPNPQTKAMTYIFPVMMTVLFANFPAGLNMYYTIQNLAALPQQWLISNERARNAQIGKT